MKNTTNIRRIDAMRLQQGDDSLSATYTTTSNLREGLDNIAVSSENVCDVLEKLIPAAEGQRDTLESIDDSLSRIADALEKLLARFAPEVN